MRSGFANILAVLALAFGASGALHCERDAYGISGSPVDIGAVVDGVRRDGQQAFVEIRYSPSRRGCPPASVTALDAFERLLADEIDRRISHHSPWVGGSARAALRTIVRAQSGAGTVGIDGLVHVSERDEGDALVVTHAVAEGRLKSLPIDVPGTLARMAARVRSCEASHVEAMVLLEAVPASQVPSLRDDVLRSIDRAVGDGFGASADRRWVRQDGAPLRQGFSLWGQPDGQCSRSNSSAERAALPAGVVERATPEQSLLLLGHRANDPAVVAAARGHLMDAGWVRVARLLPTARQGSQ